MSENISAVFIENERGERSGFTLGVPPERHSINNEIKQVLRLEAEAEVNYKKY